MVSVAPFVSVMVDGFSSTYEPCATGPSNSSGGRMLGELTPGDFGFAAATGWKPSEPPPIRLDTMAAGSPALPPLPFCVQPAAMIKGTKRVIRLNMEFLLGVVRTRRL